MITNGGGGGALRGRLATLAEHVSTRVRNTAATVPAPLLTAYQKLCKLMLFFEHYHQDNYEAALEVLPYIFMYTII